MQKNTSYSVIIITALAIHFFAGSAFSKSAPLIVQEGIFLFNAGKLQLAKVKFASAANMCPTLDRPYYYMGRIAYSECRLDSARDYFSKALKNDPGQSDAYLWLGRVYIKKGLKASFFKKPFYAAKAKKMLEKAVRLNKNNTIARHDLLYFYSVVPGIFGGGKSRAAAQAESLRVQNSWEGFKAYAKFYELTDQQDLAIAEYKKAIDAFPQEIQFYRALGEIYRRDEDFSAALTLYRNAEARHPKLRNQLFFYRGQIYGDMENYEKALTVLDSALAVNPTQLAVYPEIGRVVLLWNQRLSHGRDCLLHYIQLTPNRCDEEFVRACFDLAQIYQRLNDGETAAIYYRRVIDMNTSKDMTHNARKALNDILE